LGAAKVLELVWFLFFTFKPALMKTRSLAFLLMTYLVFIFFSCQKTDVTNPAGNPPTASGLNKTLMLQLVNDQRQRGCNCGSVYYPPAAPLRWNDQLESAAAGHANDMYKNNYFSHDSQDGSTPGDRIFRAGYLWRSYGENIAKGYTSEKDVMDAWILSVDHCQNIMNASFQELGAARTGTYWVQDFGTR
jgi:uncharacterized protein YkwD